MAMGSRGVDKIKRGNIFSQFFFELLAVVLNWRWFVPFLINMCGSLLFYKTLGDSNLTYVPMIINSLTMVITGISGWLLGEKKLSKYSQMGMALIIIGVCFCTISPNLTSTDNAETISSEL
ncbi:transmembrane protein [Anaeramoeba flamelloides]|nr:transmembrane protein [Anaeramoeba flamelloides]